MVAAWSGDARALVGRSLGEFVVLEPLSRGGFGVVFRAEQPRLGREAVLKVLHTRLLGTGDSAHRFLREAHLASRLDHPYAAHIYDFGAEEDGVHPGGRTAGRGGRRRLGGDRREGPRPQQVLRLTP